jgi:phosphatidate cytidylyltransferase
MSDDDRSGGTSGGFDDWLGKEPGPDTDPYESLSDDDPEAEIADWMAFTQGDSPATDTTDDPQTSGDAEDATEEVDDTVEAVEVDTAASSDDADDSDDDSAADSDVDDSDDDAYVDFDEDEVTAEIPIAHDDGSGEQPATSVDVPEFDGGGRADTDEVPIIAGADVIEASVTNETDESRESGSLEDPDALVEMQAIVVDDTNAAADNGTDDQEPETADAVHDDTGELDPVDEPDDDTGELEVVETSDEMIAAGDADQAFSELWDQEAHEVAAASAEADPSPELFDVSQDDYLQTATREHAGLAAAIAQADDEDTEQVALVAPIPGLESTVVGFDDVVEAEGHRKARARGSGNLVSRVITAIVLIAALAASLVWRPALLMLATVVFVIGAGEFYTALTRTGRHPIAAFGFVGVIAATVGAYLSGALAITTAFILVTTVLLLYYAVIPGRRDPMSNMALTVTVMIWVGLGSYAMLIAVSEDWRPLVVGTVITVAAMDIAQYFVGRAIGRHPLAPRVSPKKTVEGLVGGIIVALTCGALLHFVPPFELTSGLMLGATVAVLAPLGDLAMSAAKRSLELKDMGSVLPGHGGFLDRIDGLLFVIPAAWAIFLWAGLL